jgi:hypothetical protein
MLQKETPRFDEDTEVKLDLLLTSAVVKDKPAIGAVDDL